MGLRNEVRLRQDDGEQHDAFKRAWHGGRIPEAGLGIADGLVQLPMAHVVDAPSLAPAVVGRDPAGNAEYWRMTRPPE
jgi:hypothetical protein